VQVSKLARSGRQISAYRLVGLNQEFASRPMYYTTCNKVSLQRRNYSFSTKTSTN